MSTEQTTPTDRRQTAMREQGMKERAAEIEARTSQTTVRIVNLSPLVECWRCKQMRPSLCSVNVAKDAASGGMMMPLCDDCAATWGGANNGR